MTHFETSNLNEGEVPDPLADARNSRVGLLLFGIYLTAYAGFVGLTAFGGEWMAKEISGVNLAVHYGLWLIVGAFGLALIYLGVCRRQGIARGQVG